LGKTLRHGAPADHNCQSLNPYQHPLLLTSTGQGFAQGFLTATLIAAICRSVGRPRAIGAKGPDAILPDQLFSLISTLRGNGRDGVMQFPQIGIPRIELSNLILNCLGHLCFSTIRQPAIRSFPDHIAEIFGTTEISVVFLRLCSGRYQFSRASPTA